MKRKEDEGKEKERGKKGVADLYIVRVTLPLL